jgi:purine-nucleoside phosphorylase
MTDTLSQAQQTTVERLRQHGPAPAVAIVLGSGWGPVADLVQDAVDLPYAELPAFPTLSVGGHAGLLRLGRIGTRSVAVLAGRKHAYETGRADGMKGAIRSLAAWGVKVLLQTNAAGSLDLAMPAGSLMLITDHLNLLQISPLVGDSGNERFVDMSVAYDAALRAQALAAAHTAGIPLHHGVYAWQLGPQFETPAEIRMLQGLGAQAVGMSTVPETILARHAGMRVLALSMLTNLGAGLQAEPLSHEQTLSAAKAGSERAVALMRAILDQIQP